tara:strand:+ start:3130 stop:3357 length:228 start_codon:yes stop_codon:yes gene_type:complete
MKEKSILILALSLLMLSFMASSFDGASIQGNYVLDLSSTNGDGFCDSDLSLLDGKYVVPCADGKLHWDLKETFNS